MLRTPAIVFILLALSISPVEAQSQEPIRTLLDGVFSDAQAMRGRDFYGRFCLECHGDALQGVHAPRLRGDLFIDQWREAMMDGLYDFIRRNMPPRSASDTKPIADNEYLDIVTYIFSVNGYPTGSNDLTPDLVESVKVVGKDGPQSVPSGALVVTVGCLSPGSPGEWILVNATEPSRVRSSASTREELTASAQRNLGTLTFRLADREALPQFSADAHKGHKMQVKGYVYWQQNAARINLTSIEMVDSRCEIRR